MLQTYGESSLKQYRRFREKRCRRLHTKPLSRSGVYTREALRAGGWREVAGGVSGDRRALQPAKEVLRGKQRREACVSSGARAAPLRHS